ncbi:hypothetical protein NDU88_011301 [Pleurodeles waltl]|uniref:Uncharacterized protein n=1 Tax=Pleurodeles waltl TaxID=8319 RepID=A0AAV7R189_PLEWA|nr:hypothetical protein NDU88_011301 [Pleurodeles waltl]
MSAGRCSYAGEESGAANWSRAALELRRSCRAAARVSLRGIGSRGSTSTSCPAVPPKPAFLEFAEPLASGQQLSKPAHEVGALISTPLPARRFSATATTSLQGAPGQSGEPRRLSGAPEDALYRIVAQTAEAGHNAAILPGLRTIKGLLMDNHDKMPPVPSVWHLKRGD